MDETKSTSAFSVIAAACFFMLCIYGAIFLAAYFTTGNTLEEIEKNADNLTFYLDGVEVLYENIDINMYNFSYEKDSNKVFLTHKETGRRTIIPIFLR